MVLLVDPNLVDLVEVVWLGSKDHHSMVSVLMDQQGLVEHLLVAPLAVIVQLVELEPVELVELVQMDLVADQKLRPFEVLLETMGLLDLVVLAMELVGR